MFEMPYVMEDFALPLFLILRVLLYFGMLILLSWIADTTLLLLSKGIYQVTLQFFCVMNDWRNILTDTQARAKNRVVMFSVILTISK